MWNRLYNMYIIIRHNNRQSIILRKNAESKGSRLVKSRTQFHHSASSRVRYSFHTKSSRSFQRILLMLFITGTRVYNNRLNTYAGEVITIGIRHNTFLTTLGNSYFRGARGSSANYSSVVFYFRYPQKPRV